MSEPWAQPQGRPFDQAPQVRNPFATPSIVFAALTVVVAVGSRVVSLLLPILTARLDLSVREVGTVFNLLNGLELVVALAAAGLGLAGVRRRDAPRGVAAAGLGVGATAVATFVLGLISTLLVTGLVGAR